MWMQEESKDNGGKLGPKRKDTPLERRKDKKELTIHKGDPP